MIKRNWIKSLAIAICLIIPALFLSACGDVGYIPPETRYAWGRTFTYQGASFNDHLTIGGNNGTPRGKLLKDEYTKGNLDLANAFINGVAVDLSQYSDLSADAFFQHLISMMEARLHTMCDGITIVVSTEEELTVTVNKKPYKLVETSEGSNYFTLIDESAVGGAILSWGNMSSLLLNSSGDGQEVNYGLDISVFDENINAYDRISTIDVTIPTFKIVNDETAVLIDNKYSTLSISLKPYFNEAV